MMSIQAEPRHYAGLALLKLADNFENHVAIAQEGGIQALLRLGRERTTDEELQYKAALTVGTLASNAVKMMPPTAETHGTAVARAMLLVVFRHSIVEEDDFSGGFFTECFQSFFVFYFLF